MLLSQNSRRQPTMCSYCVQIFVLLYLLLYLVLVFKKKIFLETNQRYNFLILLPYSTLVFKKKNIQNIPGDNPLYVTIFLAIVFTTIFNTSIKKKGMTSHDILLIL